MKTPEKTKLEAGLITDFLRSHKIEVPHRVSLELAAKLEGFKSLHQNQKSEAPSGPAPAPSGERFVALDCSDAITLFDVMAYHIEANIATANALRSAGSCIDPSKSDLMESMYHLLSTRGERLSDTLRLTGFPESICSVVHAFDTSGDTERGLRASITMMKAMSEKYPPLSFTLKVNPKRASDSVRPPEGKQQVLTLTKPVDDPELARLPMEIVNWMFHKAVAARASDLNVEIDGEECLIAIRSAGDRVIICKIPNEMGLEVVNLLRSTGMMAINLDEHTRGSFRFVSDNTDYTVRCEATAKGANMFGSVHCRIMRTSGEAIKPSLSPNNRKLLTEIITRPMGLILIGGGTGSGRTSLIYAILDEISSEHLKVLTIEDPIERRIKGVEQHQVTLLSSSQQLATAFLQMEPDVIVFGDIRCEGELRAAIDAAQTGVLVIASVQSRTALSAPDQIAESASLKRDLSEVIVGLLRPLTIKKKDGRNTAIVEVYQADRFMKNTICAGATKAAPGTGQSLGEEALYFVEQGLISKEEADKITAA